MAVAVDEGFARQLGKRNVLGVFLEELAEQEDLLREGAGALIVREQVDEFVAEDGGAAGFEDNDGRAGFDLGEKLVHDFEKQAPGAVEEADVVERASAAEMGAGNGDGEAGGFEDFDGGAGGRGKEVVVESVGPEEDGASASRWCGRARRIRCRASLD